MSWGALGTFSVNTGKKNCDFSDDKKQNLYKFKLKQTLYPTLPVLSAHCASALTEM